MAEPARKFDPVYDPEDEGKPQGARERANQRWGMEEPNEEPEDSQSTREDDESKPARERANERWGMSPEQLQQAEENSEGDSFYKPDKDESRLLDQAGPDQSGDEKRGGPRKLFTRRRAVGGGVAGLIIAALFGGFTFLSGPLQFIHIAQLLQKFHFANQEDVSDDRMLKIARFIRYPDKRERLRLNILGNRYADRIERRLNKSGIVSAYTKNLAFFNGYEIDRTKIPDNSEFSRIKNMSDAEVIEHFRTNYDVTLQVHNGKLVAPADGLGYFKSLKLIRSVLRESGYSKIGSAIRARIMATRGALDLHPLKRLDRRILKSIDARLAKWQEDRRNRIQNRVDDPDGARFSEDTEGRPDADGDGSPDSTPGADDVGRAADDATPTRVPTETPEARVGKVRTSLGVAGGVTAVVGVVCAVQSIAENIDSVKQSNVVQPLMRLGGEMIAVGNQVMSGNDMDFEQLGFYAKNLSDPETGSWAAARSIQAENGQELTGPDILPEAEIKTERSAISQFLGSIPGLGTLCNAAGSIFGQAVTTAIGIFTGPFSELGGQAFSAFAAPKIIDGVIRWLAGEQIDLNVAGADFGNYINFGARLAANDSFIAGGGTALSGAETAELKNYRSRVDKKEMQEKSFASRVFDPYDSSSLVSKLIDRQSPDLSQNFARLATSPLGNFASLAKLPSLLFAPVRAQSTSYDYGFPEYGYSLSEINNDDPTITNPFANSIAADDILSGSRGNELKERAKKCFGIEFDANNNPSSQNTPPPYYEMPDTCDDNDTDWLHVRFYIFDTQLMDATACFEGDEDSCNNVGFGSGTASPAAQAPDSSQAVGDIGESSDSVACAAGTTDLGVATSKYSGSLKKGTGPLLIRLCRLSEIGGRGNDITGRQSGGGAVVNSRVSAAWQELGRQAKAAGVPLAASSSFRLNDSCGGTGDGSLCARPGSSPHQLGVAIDFQGTDVTGSSTTSCSGRARDPGSPAWTWLLQNAERFGFKQYSYESWHWDPINSVSRCGTNQ